MLSRGLITKNLLYIRTVLHFVLSLQWNLVDRNSRGPSKMFVLTYVASCTSVVMSGDFKVAWLFHFNSVHINKVSL